jgi:iron complex outermembrane receptor protein
MNFRSFQLASIRFALWLPVGFLLCLLSCFLLAAAQCAQAQGPMPDTSVDGASAPCTAEAGGPSRRLYGMVTDPSGAGVPHAQIVLDCGSLHITAAADATGAYSVLAPAGRYQFSAEAPNFEVLHQTVTIADTSAGTEMNPVLQLGQMKSSVIVTAGNEYATTATSSGTKTELPLNEIPQAITVINRDLMNSQDVVKLDDALRNVAGVMPGGYYDGWDYYRIRGFDASFNTYVDGLRGGNGMMEETWGLESIEVLKGPSSALYGQSVLGGLVNLVTRKPVPESFAHVQVTGGSFNFVDPAIDAGMPLNTSRTLYGRMVALYHSADTFVDYTYRHRYYVAPSLTWHPSAATYFTLLGRVERDNGRQPMPLPADGTVLPNPNGPIPISRYIGELEAHADQLAQANQQIGYQFSHQFHEHLSLHQNARFDWYQQNWNRIYYPGYLGADQRTLYRYPLNWYGPWRDDEVDTHLDGHASFWGMEHSALVGFDFFRSPATAMGESIDFSDLSQYEPLDLFAPVYGANPVRPLSLYTTSNTVTQYAGTYVQDHIALPGRVTITGGGRLDFAKNESKGSPNQNSTGLTPRLGITWQAVPSTALYASFSKSFLPQSGQVYNGTTSGASLPPERGQQWEGGLKSSFWDGKALATIAVFQLNRNNVSTTDPSHPNFYLVTGEQRSRGVEFEATLHPLTGWNLTTAYSYTNAEVLHDTTIPAGTPTLNAPRNIFNVWTTYEIPRGFLHGLLFGVGGQHYTDQAGDLENSFQLPGYGLLNASLSYHHGPMQWQVNANNLTDKRYFSGSYNDLYVKPGEPRTLRGTISWNF